MSTEVQKTDTQFLKISRDQMDEVVDLGSAEFLATLSTRTTEELRTASRRADELRAQKTKDTYLVFPVSTPKQLNAGKLYLGRLAAFRAAVRTELAKRAGERLFAPATADETVAA
jgi:hypothetical protein